MDGGSATLFHLICSAQCFPQGVSIIASSERVVAVVRTITSTDKSRSPPSFLPASLPASLFSIRLALLWFHTIVRPFFGLDGSNLKSGADAAQRLIEASRPEFADSALFLFFQGRVERLKVSLAVCLLLRASHNTYCPYKLWKIDIK